MHFVRTQLDATWTTGNYITLVPDWIGLEGKIFKAVNGDRGGCWAPTSKIYLNAVSPGQGLHVTVSTPVKYGGTLTTTNGARFFLDATGPGGPDYPRLASNHVGRTRTIVTPCINRRAIGQYTHNWILNPTYQAIQSIACTIQPAGSTFGGPDGTWRSPEQPAFLLPLRVHDGSRLVSATITFRVPQVRTNAPLIAPRMRIIRVDADGNVDVLASTKLADAFGYLPVSSATSGAAWYANGAVQSFTYVCDQNNVIQVSNYHYYAQIIEEVAAQAPVEVSALDGNIIRERKVPVQWIYTTGVLSLAGVPVSAAAGDRILLTAQTFPAVNGIWQCAAGAWVRPADMNIQDHFSKRFFLSVQQDGTTWECTGPVAGTSGVTIQTNSASTTGTPITFQRRTPGGNIYHAVACNFDSIVDMRPQ